MERWLVLKLRVATKDDFATEIGDKKLGVLYFCKAKAGNIERRPYYLTEGTCMVTFKTLYNDKQLYVPVFERSEMKECEEDKEEIIN